MSDGYARVGDRLGVASVTHGPGVTNALTALTEAVRARPARGPDGRHRAATRPSSSPGPARRRGVAGAGYHRVLRAEHVAADLESVVRRVLTARRPVLFDLPVDLHRHEVVDEPRLHPIAVPSSGAPAPDDLDRALGVLASARRPVILAGREQ